MAKACTQKLNSRLRLIAVWCRYSAAHALTGLAGVSAAGAIVKAACIRATIEHLLAPCATLTQPVLQMRERRDDVRMCVGR